METLSPRKYIQTKVRKLPIYKCFVNKAWKEAGMCNVMIMRRHNNGNVTAGFYLVDLLCLGIKQTFYFFNRSEQAIYESMSPALLDELSEVDYNLAHNIVYAGHDFALDFEIQPHPEFATTRFILEEDNETVPLIEIQTGDHSDGKPHLMAYSDTDRKALAKLKKHAGDGNYYYTTEIKTIDDDDDDEWDEENEDEGSDWEEILLDEIEIGELNMQNVQDIKTEELMNIEKVKQRDVMEQLIINTELMVRMLPDELIECVPAEELKWEKEGDELNRLRHSPNNVQQWQTEECYRVTETILLSQLADGSQYEKQFIDWLNKYPSNPLLVSFAFGASVILSMNTLKEVSENCAEKLWKDYPCVQLSLALGRLIDGHADPRFGATYGHDHIKDAFPGCQQYFIEELVHFWLIKTWLCLEKNNLRDALQYYFLVRDAGQSLQYISPVILKLNEALLAYLQTVDAEN